MEAVLIFFVNLFFGFQCLRFCLAGSVISGSSVQRLGRKITRRGGEAKERGARGSKGERSRDMVLHGTFGPQNHQAGIKGERSQDRVLRGIAFWAQITRRG